jgi:hypothetical protein
MNEQWRKMIRTGGALCALTLAMLAVSPASRAESIRSPEGQLVSGALSETRTLDITGPGYLSVKVVDLGVPLTIADKLSSLSFSINNATKGTPLAFVGTGGELALGINAAGLYSICISATAGGRFNLGIVSWQINWTPSVTAVPLPEGFWLMLAGVAAAIGLQRTRGMLRNQSVTYGT